MRIISIALFAAALLIQPLALQPGADIPLVRVQSGSETLNAIVDTGGVTETKERRPADFQTYYSGLPISVALGADYLRDHEVSAGSSEGTPQAIPLRVRTVGKATVAVVECTIGGSTYQMLLDTAALAWRSSDSEHRSPQAVIFLSGPAFTELAGAHPAWPIAADGYQIVTERGLFVAARSLVAPRVECAGHASTARLVVERDDLTTYQRLKLNLGEDIQGDASLSAFPAKGVTLEFSNSRMLVYL